jgi:hypothetical protein
MCGEGGVDIAREGEGAGAEEREGVVENDNKKRGGCRGCGL